MNYFLYALDQQSPTSPIYENKIGLSKIVTCYNYGYNLLPNSYRYNDGIFSSFEEIQSNYPDKSFLITHQFHNFREICQDPNMFAVAISNKFNIYYKILYNYHEFKFVNYNDCYLFILWDQFVLESFCLKMLALMKSENEPDLMLIKFCLDNLKDVKSDLAWAESLNR